MECIPNLVSEYNGITLSEFNLDAALARHPQFTLQAYDKGYPITFLIMFLAALLTSSLAVKLKEHAKQSAKAAYRTKVLFDTNQLLQQAKDKNEIVSATANQLIKLLGKDIVFYLTEDEKLGEPHIFTVSGDKTDKEITGIKEKAVAEWAQKNNKHAGATTETLSNANCLYLAVRVNSRVYGVVGIYIGDEPLDSFEKSILLSILGECALSLENEKNAREKKRQFLLRTNSFVQISCELFRTICEHRLLLFRETPATLYQTAIHLTKLQRFSFIRIFTMIPCG